MENACSGSDSQVAITPYSLNDIVEFDRETAVTFGVFDGIHLGHQAVINTLLKHAAHDNLASVLVGFYPHPLAFLAPERCPPLLTPLLKRVEILQQFGVDEIVMLSFDAQIASMSPEAFVERVLLEKCRAKHVVVGYACQFGKNRAGNAERLVELSNGYAFDVSVVPPTEIKGAPVHSTRIREALAQGDLRQSAQLLGRPYSLIGKVVHGDGRGREIGFPTANIETQNQVYPPNGVYAIRAKLEERWLDGVLNIGMRPTFNGVNIQVEGHFFNFDEIIYGKIVEIFFVKKIRSERKFSNIEFLVQQIQRDIAAATEILASPTSL
ncbi:MAG: bifunctional riboflavin kinase/FAD synthetase [Candidatus Poribacteria bacterium]|nr:bifunctional riboflavin kinase/FAD synthetase [Candidatus Poribacteria bacterium]